MTSPAVLLTEYPGPLQEPDFHSYWAATAYIGLSNVGAAKVLTEIFQTW
jgi:hypothetical protein